MNPQEKKLLYKADCRDLSSKKLSIDKLVNELSRIRSNTPLMLLDISYNINIDESQQPSSMDKLMGCLQRMMEENRNITSLLISGNHLFDRTPHPANQHLKDYLKELTVMLSASSITEIDISDNNVIGHTGNQLSGLAALSRQYIFKKAKSFICRLNRLHSNSLLFVSEGLGTFSSLTYLDLSDNYPERDASGTINMQGMKELCGRISQTMKLKTLNLARNELSDDSFVYIFEAIETMPQVRVRFRFFYHYHYT
jgi:hypothetical protein